MTKPIDATDPTSPARTPQRVLLIGARGLIGGAIRQQLDAQGDRYEVVNLGRSTQPGLDLELRASIEQTLDGLAPFDHVVVAAGEAHFAPVDTLDEPTFQLGLDSKLMGQVRVALAALPHLRPAGSITLTSGALSHSPVVGSTPAAMVNGAIDSFVRAVAFEIDDGRRINAVSPGWVIDTLLKFDMDPTGGVPAEEVAALYMHALQSDLHGEIVDATPNTPRANEPAQPRERAQTQSC